VSKMGVVCLFSIAAAAVGVRVGVWARVIPVVPMSWSFCDGRGWAQKGGGQKRTSMLFLCLLALASGLLLFSRVRTRLHAQTTGKHTPGTQTPVPDTHTHAHSPRARLSVRAWAHQKKKREDTRPLSRRTGGWGLGFPFIHSNTHPAAFCSPPALPRLLPLPGRRQRVRERPPAGGRLWWWRRWRRLGRRRPASSSSTISPTTPSSLLPACRPHAPDLRPVDVPSQDQGAHMSGRRSSHDGRQGLAAELGGPPPAPAPPATVRAGGGGGGAAAADDEGGAIVVGADGDAGKVGGVGWGRAAGGLWPRGPAGRRGRAGWRRAGAWAGRQVWLHALSFQVAAPMRARHLSLSFLLRVVCKCVHTGRLQQVGNRAGRASFSSLKRGRTTEVCRPRPSTPRPFPSPP